MTGAGVAHLISMEWLTPLSITDVTADSGVSIRGPDTHEHTAK